LQTEELGPVAALDQSNMERHYPDPTPQPTTDRAQNSPQIPVS